MNYIGSRENPASFVIRIKERSGAMCKNEAERGEILSTSLLKSVFLSLTGFYIRAEASH
jgi:hypothetical protein